GARDVELGQSERKQVVLLIEVPSSRAVRGNPAGHGRTVEVVAVVDVQRSAVNDCRWSRIGLLGERLGGGCRRCVFGGRRRICGRGALGYGETSHNHTANESK